MPRRAGPDFIPAALPRLLHAGRYDAEDRCPLHGHAGVEILLVRRGRCIVTVGEQELPAEPNSLFVLPRRADHRHRDLGRVATSYLIVAAPPGVAGDRLRHLQLAPDERLAGWIEDIIDLRRLPGCENTVGALLLAVLARIDVLAQAMVRPPRALSLAVAHLERRLLENVPPAQLARAAGVSVSHLAELFRTHLGCPPLRWQRRRRLELARRLLAGQSMPVAEVARACGWSDANLFGRIFRAEHGQSPGRWRAVRTAGP
ncbi:MAG: helix-turn-helix transcriptional regulator [Planctomycetes bacterium]|nr:helix-turn-helix transcriptional regulator [Planctomycetota bacterium]